ncbi:iron chelate uptake ABC transporter family permease subunit [Pelagibacterium nitratireducens]|uniref:Iron chelate uptake ABC transporter family permease subunit n=1 Tax=Pelagibacterium nitratireducens TaxID=1046114 RepID=A0ABZ2I9V3_9HYPH
MARRRIAPEYILAGLAVLTVITIVLFMTVGARGSWGFVLSFRGTKVLTMVLVAYAIGLSTVMFQTVMQNRILTPSIMGFDSLYVLIQTATVFLFGGLAAATVHPYIKFSIELGAMLVFSGLLCLWMFSGRHRSLHLMVLVGIVIGTLFRSMSNFMVRIIDPNEFARIQDSLFASFNSLNTDLLTVSMVIIGLATVVAWRIGHTFDVLSLGRETAINLGVPYKRTVLIILLLVTLLVSVSTALVGPVTFFGLLVANLGYLMMGTSKHRYVLPATIMLGVICLLGGQLILERVFNFTTAISVIIEFAGGLVFIILILRGAAR